MWMAGKSRQRPVLALLRLLAIQLRPSYCCWAYLVDTPDAEPHCITLHNSHAYKQHPEWVLSVLLQLLAGILIVRALFTLEGKFQNSNGVNSALKVKNSRLHPPTLKSRYPGKMLSFDLFLAVPENT